MTVKASWLFNGGNAADAGKVYGFSESWYSGLTDDALIAAMDTVSAIRRLVLSEGTSIVGYRIGQDNGRSYVVRKSWSAPRGAESGNLPVDAALCQVKVQGGVAVKKFFIHDLPDNYIQNGNITIAAKPRIEDVVRAYLAGGFQIRYQNQSAISAPILSIDISGNVVTTDPINLIVHNRIKFLQVRDTNNRPVRGTFIVDQVTNGNSFRVAHWTGQVVVQTGRVRLNSFQFGNAALIGTAAVVAAASRKVGRPFFQSRGRVPARR